METTPRKFQHLPLSITYFKSTLIFARMRKLTTNTLSTLAPAWYVECLAMCLAPNLRHQGLRDVAKALAAVDVHDSTLCATSQFWDCCQAAWTCSPALARTSRPAVVRWEQRCRESRPFVATASVFVSLKPKLAWISKAVNNYPHCGWPSDVPFYDYWAGRHP